MKTSKYFLLSLLITLFVSYSLLAQGPGEAFKPMTANGAKEIWTIDHQLFWVNPSATRYNEVYISTDSNLVANMDTSVRILNGYPSAVYSSTDLTSIEPLAIHKIYYWMVVEYDSTSFTIGKLWWFESTCSPSRSTYFFDDFESGLDKWLITNDGGTCIWEDGHILTIYQLDQTNASEYLLTADSDLCGSGTTLLSTAVIDTLFTAPVFTGINLSFDMDWRINDSEDEAHVEFSIDYGETWESIRSWVGVDNRNSIESINLYPFVACSEFLIRFRVVQPGWDWWWVIDNVMVDVAITSFIPSRNLLMFVNQQISYSVNLTWMSSNLASESFIERKTGLPLDNNPYEQIGQVNNFNSSFTDTTVVDSTIYTYRIRSGQGGGYVYSNETTVYINVIVPVELLNFTAYVNNNNIHLEWTTATETNNLGFEIEKKTGEWRKIGFVTGHGTTIEQQHYSFVDESISSGNYQYRLKQIDYDGTFEYSDIVEVEVSLPTEFSLEQNYPNPFNPTTTIKFSIPTSPLNPSPYQGEGQRERFITLIVYDVLGNEIATLVNEEKPAGSYEIEFSVGHNSILSLSSGIYFYQLKAGSFIQTKKMILMK